jgi:hypothetical protein
MSRDGRKVWEGFIQHGEGMKRSAAIIRMTDSLRFSLEVDDLTFEGDNPKELRLKAEMTLCGEATVQWKPIILIDPDLEEGRLMYRRLFEGTITSSGRTVYRHWRIGEKDESSKARYSVDVETYANLTLGAPGGRARDGQRIKDRLLPYSPALWDALNRLDLMLKETNERVAAKVRELIESADLTAKLAAINATGPKALVYDPKKGEASHG